MSTFIFLKRSLDNAKQFLLADFNKSNSYHLFLYFSLRKGSVFTLLAKIFEENK